MIKKVCICILFIFIFGNMISCTQNEEKINKGIEEQTISLIELDWKLHNLRITYDDYYNEAKDIFLDDSTLKSHIKDVLHPMILEDINKIDQSTIEKYRKIDYKDYDIPSIKLSKVYTDDITNEKHIFIHAIISPYSIQNIYDTGVVFANTDYSIQQERSIEIIFINNDKNHWRIKSYEGNSYLLSLKENLSTEFISEYTTYMNIPVEYITEMKLINP